MSECPLAGERFVRTFLSTLSKWVEPGTMPWRSPPAPRPIASAAKSLGDLVRVGKALGDRSALDCTLHGGRVPIACGHLESEGAIASPDAKDDLVPRVLEDGDPDVVEFLQGRSIVAGRPRRLAGRRNRDPELSPVVPADLSCRHAAVWRRVSARGCRTERGIRCRASSESRAMNNDDGASSAEHFEED